MIVRSSANTIERSKIVLIDSLSVPNTIGKGPIKMIPPPLIFPPLAFVWNSRKMAARMMRTPQNIRVNPKA